MDYEAKAKENLKDLIKVIRNLFIKEKIEFDLIIGSGESGITMVYLTDLILTKLNINIPQKLILPFFRYTEKYVPYGDPFDNSALIDDIETSIENIKNLDNVLFADDEIGSGITIKGILKLLSKSNLLNRKLNLYIIAEDRGFNPESLSNFAKTKFLPFGQESRGHYNAIFYLIPDHVKQQIIKNSGELNIKTVMNCLLGLPVKEINNGKPIWTHGSLDEIKQKVPNFEKLQMEFKDYLKEFISKELDSLRLKEES